MRAMSSSRYVSYPYYRQIQAVLCRLSMKLLGHLGTGVSIDVNPGNAFKANLQSVLISIIAELPCRGAVTGGLSC